jgi:low affinity Fe/Cu permease
MRNFFTKFAHKASNAVGSPWAFIIALTLIAAWAISGPLLGFSDTWQLAINTTTTIVTFLMVFLIQNQQNRDSKAMELKLDEIIRSARSARDTLIDIEELSDEELEKLEEDFRQFKSKKSLK